MDLLSAAAKKIVANPDYTAKLNEMAMGSRYMDAAQLGAYWDAMDVQLKLLMELAKQN